MYILRGLEPSNYCQDTNACSLCSSPLYRKTFSQVSSFNLLSICYPARLQKLQKLFFFLPHPTHPALHHLPSNNLIQLFLHPLLGLYMLEIMYSPKASEGKIYNSFWKYIIIFWFVNSNKTDAIHANREFLLKTMGTLEADSPESSLKPQSCF